MKTSEIRQKFLSFFEERGHHPVPSSSLIPANDPSLLFTNAGMVQFKDVFTGKEKRSYSKAVSSQRCVRAGGKHNDLENVGYTARHHTFFEMLGNFSFGDYFKQEAIFYAWELLTKVYGLPAEKLWVTVYHEDDEAYNIWANDIGVPEERIIRIGDDEGGRYSSDNFWQMADTGPCGPCSEVFYDHGPEIWGGPPGSPEEDGDRYIEIWNLVFMQFDRQADGTMLPLPKPCVDTGMGLERVSAVLQNVHSNYEIDLFQDLIREAAKLTNTTDLENNSLKVIADHIRACSFLITDGVIPGNEGRGYVLRRIIRRALRHGHKLGQSQPFFYKLAAKLAKLMGNAYPELIQQGERIAQILEQEEERFSATLDNGMKILESALSKLQSGGTLDGQTLFTLYDTYGFPVDLTADICRERNVLVDFESFDAAMQQQRDQARAAGRFHSNEGLVYDGNNTDFKGYETLESEAEVVALYKDGLAVSTLASGDTGVVVLDSTPFYAEAGGQVGDQGVLQANGISFQVSDTRKIQDKVFGHYGSLESGSLAIGSKVKAIVNAALRTHTIRNHSATHLMHKAMKQVLGNHVQQRGSLVDPYKTRFDFAHDSPLSPSEIEQIERIVNAEIIADQAVTVQMLSFDEAVEGGAVALFGEKYEDTVRVLDIGFSRELCGGTHVQRTGEIGLFKIISEGGVASGVRRIEAITGENALAWVQKTANTLQQAASLLKTGQETILERLEALQSQLRELERERDQLTDKLTSAAGNQVLDQAIPLTGNSKLLVASLEGIDPKQLRSMTDQAKNSLESAIVLLASVTEGRISLVAGVTSDLTNKVKAGELLSMVAAQINGKGGGRPDMAMGGGSSVEDLPKALASVKKWSLEKING